MITQGIKSWLDKLFAWWPWRKHPVIGYAQATSNVNTSSPQEPFWHLNIDGAGPQPGITSVAVEHGNDEQPRENDRSIPEPHSEVIIPQRQPVEEKNLSPPFSPVSVTQVHRASPENIPAPTAEQHLAFLRYLVQKGLVNEGFAEGHVPDQYKR